MDCYAKCDICGEKYDNYMRTFYIQCSNNDSDIKCCCTSCWRDEVRKKPYRYTNHIPAFCEGGDLITKLFDSKEELINWLNNKISLNKDEILCCSDEGTIITVNKNKKFWWVMGRSNLEKGDLPDWEDIVIKYHGNL